MKIFLNLALFFGVASAAHNIADFSLTKKQTLSVDATMERKLRGGCSDDFVCPQGSERKPNRDCYDSFADCKCKAGYERTSNGCAAQEGLCTIEYAEMIEDMQGQVDFWVAKAYSATDKEEQYTDLQEMNTVLAAAWDNYNKGIASCEVYGFSDEIDGDGERRQLLFGFIRKAFKKVAETFIKVAKAVVSIFRSRELSTIRKINSQSFSFLIGKRGSRHC